MIVRLHLVPFYHRFRPETIPPREGGELEPVEVSAERKRVHATRALHAPLRVNTIGNINRGQREYSFSTCDINVTENV